jgi:transcriptional regulator with XRE-family HTH domain
MVGQGRRPDPKQRQRAAQLRAAGLSYTEIAERLGVTKPCVLHLLQLAKLEQPPPGICCRECGKQLVSSGRGIPYRMRALCLKCLARHPEAPFSERLRAFRLAAGLTFSELALRASIGSPWLSAYESGSRMPRRGTMARLIRVLGIELVTLGLEKPKSGNG